METTQLIAYLNAINVGDLDNIEAKLQEARNACLELDQSELADQLDEARLALSRADIRTYRRRVETVIARLGHLK